MHHPSCCQEGQVFTLLVVAPTWRHFSQKCNWVTVCILIWRLQICRSPQQNNCEKLSYTTTMRPLQIPQSQDVVIKLRLEPATTGPHRIWKFNISVS